MRRLVLLSALTLLACGQRKPVESRGFRVVGAADPTFRARPHWRDVISSRIHDVSLLYDREFHIQLELVDVEEWGPGTQMNSEQKRRLLGSRTPDPNLLQIGFTTPDGGAEPGIALAFDPRVLVFDLPNGSEEQNELRLAHELAHVFAAWHSNKSDSVLHLPPGNSFDSAARDVVHLTRLAPLGRGPSALDPESEAELAKLYTSTGLNPEANPLFQSYLFIGHELWTGGNHEKALDPLARAAVLSPGDLNVHYMIAKSYLVMNRYADAESEFRKVLKMNPAHAVAWNGLGGALLNMRRYEESEAAFRKALQLDPGNPSVGVNLGRAMVHLSGQVDQGIAQIQAVLKTNPNDAYVQQALKDVLAFKEQNAGSQPAPGIAR
ncbi:MAG TPA: tetratricopeptide repeat protein [Bryobacteraceae bacterium]|nr:tetratricopeptide repeat protein [Bryobacteraceae bacterium]